MSEYYHLHHEAYHEATFHIDPASFLLPLAGRLPPCAVILDAGRGCRPGLVTCFCNRSRLRFRHMGARQCCRGLRLPPRISHAIEDDPYGE